jgi:uncharacterized membrane protein
VRTGALNDDQIKIRRITMNVEFTEMTFDNKSTAAEALKELYQWHTSGVVKVFNAAVLVKDKQGKVSIKETENVDAQRGGLLGAIVGGLIGLVDGAPGSIVRAAAGADMSGVAARLIDFGFPNGSLRDLQDSLQPGSSALVFVIEPLRIYAVVEDLAHWGGRLFHYTLKTGLVQP